MPFIPLPEGQKPRISAAFRISRGIIFTSDEEGRRQESGLALGREKTDHGNKLPNRPGEDRLSRVRNALRIGFASQRLHACRLGRSNHRAGAGEGVPHHSAGNRRANAWPRARRSRDFGISRRGDALDAARPRLSEPAGLGPCGRPDRRVAHDLRRVLPWSVFSRPRARPDSSSSRPCSASASAVARNASTVARSRARAPFTAIASAFRWPTTTTSLLPRVTPV